MSPVAARRWRQFGLYAACYAIWVGLSALALLATLQLMSAISYAYVYYRVKIVGVPHDRTVDTAWQLSATNQLLVLALILVWLVGVVFLEGYLRSAARDGRLWSRSVRVFSGLLIALGVLFGVRIVL